MIWRTATWVLFACLLGALFAVACIESLRDRREEHTLHDRQRAEGGRVAGPFGDVVVYRDERRGVTCWVPPSGEGIACLRDGQLAARDVPPGSVLVANVADAWRLPDGGLLPLDCPGGAP